MKKSDVGIFCAARTSSTRCKKKMIRSFADTSLTDILLSKLAKIGGNVFFSGYESLFEEKCHLHGIPFVQRTEKSALSEGPLLEVFDFLADQPYEYFLFFNGCLPFLKTETISKFLDICIEDDKPKFAVLKRNNYFTDMDGNPYNFDKDLKIMDTKLPLPLGEGRGEGVFLPQIPPGEAQLSLHSKGGVIESLVFSEISDQSLFGTTSHHEYDDIRVSTDQFSGHV